MKVAVLLMCVAGFVVASTWSAIQFKYAAEESGKKAIWHFVAGNIIGAFGPLALTLALKRTSPSLGYALCYGCSFAVLQVVCWRVFNQPLSTWQWAGIVLVAIGIFLLQMRGT